MHFAAAVGVGQSMYEIERYTSINAMGAAILLEEIAKHRDQLGRVLVASSMSIYGEGGYRCPLHGLVAPQVRSDEQLDRREWELTCDGVRRGAGAAAHRRDEAALPDVDLRHQQARPRGDVPRHRARAPAADRRAALLQRLRLRARRCPTPTRAWRRSSAARLLNDNAPLVFEDGLQSRDFVHVSDIAAGVVTRAGGGRRRLPRRQPGHRRPDDRAATSPASWRAAWASDIEPEIVSKFRAGDIRHCFADISLARELLGFEPQVRFEDGMRELLGWVATQQATDTVDSASKELEAAGLTR